MTFFNSTRFDGYHFLNLFFRTSYNSFIWISIWAILRPIKKEILFCLFRFRGIGWSKIMLKDKSTVSKYFLNVLNKEMIKKLLITAVIDFSRSRSFNHCLQTFYSKSFQTEGILHFFQSIWHHTSRMTFSRCGGNDPWRKYRILIHHWWWHGSINQQTNFDDL